MVPRRFLLAAMLALALVACGDNDESAPGATPTPTQGGAGFGEPITVVATTAQIGALVREVAGGEVDLYILMGSGIDPHDFELTPGHLRTLGSADLILKNGIGLDDFMDSSIDAAGGNATVVTVTEGIDLVTGGHHHDDDDDHAHDDDDNHAHDDDDHAHDDDDHAHDDDDNHAHDDDDHAHDDDDNHAHDDDDDHGHDHGEFDPHVWHDPANAIIMVENIVAALAAANPERAAIFEENGAAYIEVLEETDIEIRAMLDEIPAERRMLVTTHDAFGYFVRAYDFEFIGAVIPSVSTDAEPSARQIAELSDLIVERNVPAIFVEATVDARIAEQLANDTGVDIVYGLHSDSLGEAGSGADTVHGMLLVNATIISEALK